MNNTNVYTTMGASNHSREDRAENDLYTTPPDAVRALLEREQFAPQIWECASGLYHISNVLMEYGHNVFNSDIVDRGNNAVIDFLNCDRSWHGDIITNPPYKIALPFARKALQVVDDGQKVAMLLRIQFLEGQERRKFFDKHPPKTVYVFSKRIRCSKDGKTPAESSAVCFCWFVWEKGYNGEPVIKWL